MALPVDRAAGEDDRCPHTWAIAGAVNAWQHASDAADTTLACLQIGLFVRFMVKLQDYLGLSLPLILVSFLAAGFAIALLTADVLHKTDVTDRVIDVRNRC